jgi:ATPase subunit of ABC transporter with duplicated ATPase domains
MAQNEIIIRFDKVSFDYGYNKPILDEACFSVARGSKITFMGQNGAGKSTIFKLITGEFTPESGNVHIGHGQTIAVSKQVI